MASTFMPRLTLPNGEAVAQLGQGTWGRLIVHPVLDRIARRHGDASNAQIALAWVLRHPDVMEIPKAATEAYVRNNFAALRIRLTATDRRELDEAFPPPKKKVPLEVL